MNIFIAFLRGINVSGQKKIKMADLKIALQKSGFEQVITYIQSGNIVLKSNEGSKEIRAKIEKTIQHYFGFEVPVLMTTANDLESVLKENPFFGRAEEKNLYFTLPYGIPNKEHFSNLRPEDFPNEEFHISEKCIYLNCKLGAGKAKLSNNVIERKLKLTATTRNFRTMNKMIQLATSIS